MPAQPGKEVYRGRNVVVSFKLDRQGIRKLAVGPELRAACHAFVVTTALPHAIRLAPRSNRPATKGRPHYQDSFRVQDVITGTTPPEVIGKPPMRRVGTRLLNVAPHAIIVELGAGTKSRGARVLGRTLDHIRSLGKDEN